MGGGGYEWTTNGHIITIQELHLTHTHTHIHTLHRLLFMNKGERVIETLVVSGY